MTNVGTDSRILLVSNNLKSCLLAAGHVMEAPEGRVLFSATDENDGAFLVCKGKVRLCVVDMPNLDRSFPASSLLGLPSTFTGSPYSLTAVCDTDAEVARIPREAFLELMRQDPELCQEATAMLCREVSFINSALAQRRQQLTHAS